METEEKSEEKGSQKRNLKNEDERWVGDHLGDPRGPEHNCRIPRVVVGSSDRPAGWVRDFPSTSRMPRHSGGYRLRHPGALDNPLPDAGTGT